MKSTPSIGIAKTAVVFAVAPTVLTQWYVANCSRGSGVQDSEFGVFMLLDICIDILYRFCMVYWRVGLRV